MAVKLQSARRDLSLFGQLGGKSAIDAVVQRFYEKVLADPMLRPLFAKTSVDGLRLRQTQFLTHALGGNGSHQGPMQSAHAKLLMEPRHFERAATHLAVALSDMGLSPFLVDAVMERVAGMEAGAGAPSADQSTNGDVGSAGGLGPVHLRAMLENVPINVLLADQDLNITYANTMSVATLKILEKDLPVPADQVVGSSIDIFHKNPAYQRKILSNPKNLPHRADVQIGEDTVDLLATALYDEQGNYLGPMVTWKIVTEELATAAKAARVASMMENIPINVICADLEDLKIQYMNPASTNTLKSIEKHLPVKVDQMVGRSIDVFHANPAHQRKMLATDKNLPHKALIQVGPEQMELLVSATYDQNKKYIGPMVTWELVTQKMANEKAIQEATIREHKQGEDLRATMSAVAQNAQTIATASEELTAVSQQMSANSEETSAQATVVSSAAEQVNRNLQTVATGTEEMSASIKEIAKNANESAKVASSAVKVAERTNQTISKLGDSSAEIGQVIKVITSIAQQTNLLALNATIEAARAGEAGKGFAVVANEVKELAKETAKATEDISRKIEAIQSDTKESVEAIGAISGIIHQINEISNTIATAVEEQNATTNEMARNVGEAARGSEEISKNISGVAEAAQSTSRAVGDSQKAAEALAKTAEELRRLVAQYKG